MKTLIEMFCILQLIFISANYSFADPNNRFLDVSVNVYEKCSITRPEVFDQDSFRGVTVNCKIDTPYMKMDEFDTRDFVEKDFYDNFTLRFHPQLFIENEYCKTWCNAGADQFPPLATPGDIMKLTVLW